MSLDPIAPGSARDVLRAALAGKKVQVRSNGKWVDLSLEGLARRLLDGTSEDLRIKPYTSEHYCVARLRRRDGASVPFVSVPGPNAGPLPNLKLVFEDGKLVSAEVLP